MLYRVDIASGEVRELARPYTITFPSGGGADGGVGGLALAPDGQSVAIFKVSGGITPAPGTNVTDMAAAREWGEQLGTTVEIRSVDDGRLLGRMPGGQMTVNDVAWDPRDRFTAAVSSDALFLWNRKTGSHVVRTLDDSGIRHWLSINNDGSRLAITARRGVQIYRIEEK